MGNVFRICTALALCLPLFAAAQVVSITSQGDATSMTGGIVVSSGAAASGSSSASADIRNVINADGSGTARIEIRTSVNGDAASYKKTIRSGERLNIKLSTTSKDRSAAVRVDVRSAATSSQRAAAPASQNLDAFFALLKRLFASFGLF